MTPPSPNALAKIEALLAASPVDADELARAFEALRALPTLPVPTQRIIADAAQRWSMRTDVDADDVLTHVRQLIAGAKRRLKLQSALTTSEAIALAPAVPATPVEVRAISASDATQVAEFVAESRDLLEAAEQALLQLEASPTNHDAINVVFRSFHTVKGTSAYLAFTSIASFAHAAESLLERMRKQEIRCVGGYAELALKACDALRGLLDATERWSLNGASGPLLPPPGFEAFTEILRHPETHGVSEAAGSLNANTLPTAKSDTRTNDAHASVRVSTKRLDRLIEMVGELVIAHSIVAQDPHVRGTADGELRAKVHHAEKMAKELHALTMGMRMVTLKPSVQKVARLVRDVSAKSGKLIELSVEGADTEIDRQLVDMLGDPLVHLVRNAIDHGIESPAERLAAGKAAAGNIRLVARHASGQVVVELSDDGRGLDRARIVAVAQKRGIIATDVGLADEDVWNLIFAPGFSTAAEVTDLSGRGVGMDVVRRNIENVRGRIAIRTTPGQGTTFIMFLPLTLAVADGMLARVGKERYVIPTSHIVLSFRPEAGALTTIPGQGEVVVTREDTLPLVRLHEVFGIENAERDPRRALVVVVNDGAQRAALLVDDLIGHQQVVAKALEGAPRHLPVLAGGAILGDGRVGLILDIPALLAQWRQAAATLHGQSRAVA